jgi:hydrogenase expression/formation protein HypC
MCLGVPGQVVEPVEGYDDQLCVVDVLGARRRINTGMLDGEARLLPGDWVVVHMGFAMERLDEEDARRLVADMQQPEPAITDPQRGPGPAEPGP